MRRRLLSLILSISLACGMTLPVMAEDIATAGNEAIEASADDTADSGCEDLPDVDKTDHSVDEYVDDVSDDDPDESGSAGTGTDTTEDDETNGEYNLEDIKALIDESAELIQSIENGEFDEVLPDEDWTTLLSDYNDLQDAYNECEQEYSAFSEIANISNDSNSIQVNIGELGSIEIEKLEEIPSSDELIADGYELVETESGAVYEKYIFATIQDQTSESGESSENNQSDSSEIILSSNEESSQPGEFHFIDLENGIYSHGKYNCSDQNSESTSNLEKLENYVKLARKINSKTLSENVKKYGQNLVEKGNRFAKAADDYFKAGSNKGYVDLDLYNKINDVSKKTISSGNKSIAAAECFSNASKFLDTASDLVNIADLETDFNTLNELKSKLPSGSYRLQQISDLKNQLKLAMAAEALFAMATTGSLFVSAADPLMLPITVLLGGGSFMLNDKIVDLKATMKQLIVDIQGELESGEGDGDSGTGDSGTGDSGTGDSGTGENTGEGEMGDGETTATSEKCGDNLTWSYSNGILTINGSGDMYNYGYSDDDDVPWENYKQDIISVQLPDKITSLGDNCFCECRALSNIELPVGITSLGFNCFTLCTNLSSIELPDSITSLGIQCFAGCWNLSSIELPDGITSLSESCFDGCWNLSSIELPNGITSLRERCFARCYKLSRIELPDGITSLGDSCFYECRALSSIELPDGITSLGGTCFGWCSSLSSIELPDGIKSIDNCFDGCSSLSSIELPEGITSLTERTFCDCSSLSSIELPAGITSIENSVFSGCDKLTDVYFDGTEEMWLAMDIGGWGNDPLKSANIHFNDFPTHVYKDVDYSAVYDYYYFHANADVAAAFGTDDEATIENFVRWGMTSGRQGNKEFNVYYYMENYPVLKETYGSNLAGYYMHYVYWGKAAGWVANELLPLTLDKESLTLAGNASEEINCTSEGVGTVEWTSSDEDVAKVVSGTGTNVKIIGKKAGTATITASYQDRKASCVVTVSLALDKYSTTLDLDDDSTGEINCTKIGSGTVEWTSSDEDVVQVSSSGSGTSAKITGKKVGTATITASYNGSTVSCEVTVGDGTLSLDKYSITMNIGDSEEINCTKEGVDTVTWTSSDDEIVHITIFGTDSNAKVYGMKEGTATVTVTYRGKTATCKVIVQSDHEHKWGTGRVTLQANCVSKGTMTYSCTHVGCSETKTEEIDIDPNYHKGKVGCANYKEATTKEEGYSGDYYCEACHALILEGEVVPKIAATTVYKDLDYSAVYDYDYFHANEDVAEAFGNDTEATLANFVRWGMTSGRQGSEEFNVYIYMENYPELKETYGSNLASYYYHYIWWGKAAGWVANKRLQHDPVTVKDGVDYSAVYDYEYFHANEDVAAAFGDDDVATLNNFIRWGMTTGRQGNEEFNVKIYMANYPELKEVYGDKLAGYYMHYVYWGKDAGLVANKLLKQTAVTVQDGIDYSDVYDYNYFHANKDVADAFGDDDVATLANFVRWGMTTGRQGSAEFNVYIYMKNYPELKDVYGDKLQGYYYHYIWWGKAAGWVANEAIS